MSETCKFKTKGRKTLTGGTEVEDESAEHTVSLKQFLKGRSYRKMLFKIF